MENLWLEITYIQFSMWGQRFCSGHLEYPMQQIRIIGLPSQPYVSDAGQWVPNIADEK